MRTLLPDHPIAWVPPSPFWSDTSRGEMQRPAILRFASDDFMEELQRLLASDPEKLRGLKVVPETWRGIRVPARTPNPAGGRAGLLGRLGVATRRSATPATLRPPPSRDAAGMDLKLYQPAHQRFYLIGATLVCQQPGLPDRRIDKGKAERASFVIRRWFPPSGGQKDDNLPAFDEQTWTEHAFVAQAAGGFAWQAVADAGAIEEQRRVVLAEEDRLPLFPMNYAEDNQRGRRMLAGLIPVGRREAYLAAARETVNGQTVGGATDVAGPLTLFRKTVSEPWKVLADRAAIFHRSVFLDKDGTAKNPDATFPDLLQRFREDVQTSSWLLLADLRSYLKTYATSVWSRVQATTNFAAPGAPGGLTGNSLALYNALLATKFEPKATALTHMVTDDLTSDVDTSRKNVASCLGHALKLLDDPIDAVVAAMEKAQDAFKWTDSSEGWPRFLFPLVEAHDSSLNRPGETVFENSPVPVIPSPPSLPEDEQDVGGPTSPAGTAPAEFVKLATAVVDYKRSIDSFAALVILSLAPATDAPIPPVPVAAERPADPRPGWFVIRCVYERPACGKLHDDVVSAPTERFQLAGFFDPDAPARPIRIGLPIDTTPAGLRKFDKNTAFVMSDVLCGQVARMRGLTFGDLVLSVLPFPFHKDISVPDGGPCKSAGINAGMICSLSIPIITLCALILLMIMVSLLDFIFRWMPYFIVCFPLPGLRAKPKP